MYFIRVKHKYAKLYCSGGRIWVGEEDVGCYVSKKNRKAFHTKEEATSAMVDDGTETVIEEIEDV